MADFHTHLRVAALGSGGFSLALLSVQQATPGESFSYFVLGTVGGLLPDMDAENSIPIRLAFGLGSLLGAFLAASYLPAGHGLGERLLVGALAYLLLRYVILAAFNASTRHRGIIHSLPAALFFGFAVTGLSHHLLHTAPLIAWWQGAFVSFGFLLHLLLDEWYSVDLYGMQLKVSFGTALKLYQPDHWIATGLMYLAVGLSYLLTPSPQAWLAIAGNRRLYRTMVTQFWPQHGWLRDFWPSGLF